MEIRAAMRGQSARQPLPERASEPSQVERPRMDWVPVSAPPQVPQPDSPA